MRCILAAAVAFSLPLGLASVTYARILPSLEQSRQVLPVQSRDPALYERRNGRMEVIFSSGCRMLFNRTGKAIDAQRCSRRQEARAHEEVARHLRRQGRWRGRRGDPRINELRGGRLQIVFRSGCIIIFNRRRQAVDAQRCTRAQEARAHDAVAEHVRRHGRRGARITELRGGRHQVDFRSGCRMIFDRRGGAIDARHCSRAQERRAHDALAAHMRGHKRHGRRSRRDARIIEHRRGRLEVVFPSGCKVRFNRRGRAVDAQRCSRRQEARAKEMAAEYRRARR
jgi:CxxC motif-containing protein